MELIRILIFSDYYLPGYKAGGPIRTLANMIDLLGDDFSFKIITRDRDFGDIRPFQKIKINAWHQIGKAKVFYLSQKCLTLSVFKNLICKTPHDILYFTSFFSPHFTIKPLLIRRLGLIPKVPIILAPRGEFSPGAIKLKAFKKYLYATISKSAGLYQGLLWQASGVYEKADICKWFTKHRVIVAPDLLSVKAPRAKQRHPQKPSGSLKIVFLSRISKKKNLAAALAMLKELKGEIQFTIYGTMDDPHYWLNCQKIIKTLPSNIAVLYKGTVKHDQVISVMREHDLFFLPTLGENFGHAILEALAAGCPVLISDQTPWRNLENKGIGWDLPLSNPKLFKDVIQRCVNMNSTEWMKYSQRAKEYAFLIMKNNEAIEQNRKLFSNIKNKKNK